MLRAGLVLALALAGLASLPARAADASAPDPLARRLAAVLDDRGLRGADVSALVVDARDGAVLFAREPDRAMIPASNMKILTALAVAAELGPTHRFVTTVRSGAAPDAAGAVPWLAVQGGGDPALTSERWWRLAGDLWRRGLRRVSGDVWLDDSAFDAERWHPEWGAPSARAYHAPVGALSANYGAFAVVVAPTTPGEPARVVVDPPVSSLRVLSQARTGGAGQSRTLSVHRRPGEGFDRVVVTGRIPAGAEPEIVWRSVSDPLAYAGGVLESQLAAHGIVVEGEVRPGPAPEAGVELLAFEGRPVAELLVLLGKYSSNVIAESLVKALGARATGEPGSWEGGVEAVRRRLEALGLDCSDARIVDGSGLSRANRVSARLLVDALRTARDSFRVGPEVMASLPIAGGDGTLSKRAEGAAARVRAKTGLLDGVSTLSGYAERPDGRVVAFSLLVNGFERGAGAAMAAVDRFAEALVAP